MQFCQGYSEICNLIHPRKKVNVYKISIERFGIINQIIYNIYSVDPRIPYL